MSRGDRGGFRGGSSGPTRGGGGPPRTKAETFRLNEGKVFANYFPVNVPPNVIFYQHGVDFGGIDSRSLRKQLCRHFLKEVTRNNIQLLQKCIFDGTSIFSIFRLPVEKLSSVILVINGREYTVSITTVQEKNSKDTKDQALIQTFNVILKQAMDTCLHKIGRKHFQHDQQIDLPPDMQKLIRVLPGFQTDVSFKRVAGNYRLVVNIDTASKVISEGNVLQIIKTIQGPSRTLTSEIKAEIRRVLVGTIVYTKYNNTAYTIENIDFSMNPMSTFSMFNRETKEEEPITYMDYYAKVKNLPLKITDQPLLRSSGRNKKRVYLVPETCLVTEIDPKAKEKLPQLCSVKPNERKQRIQALPALLNTGKSKQILDMWNFQLGTEFLPVNAKALAPPQLFMPGLGYFEGLASWGTQCGRQLNFKAKETTEITAYITYEPVAQEMARDYASLIAAELNRKSAPRRLKLVPIKADKGMDPITALKQQVAQPSRPCMLICFLTPSKVNYSKVKEFSNKFGYISQCLNIVKQRAKADQKGTIVNNLMKQIMNKFGYLCWWAEIPKCSPTIGERPLMMVGIDVYHAKKRFVEKDLIYHQRRSIGAFIAVHVAGGYKTSCEIIEVEARKELLCKPESDSEQSSVRSHDSSANRAAELRLESPNHGPDITNSDTLLKFMQRSCAEHQITPAAVIVYRDGVGDSMFDAVKSSEVRQAKEAIRSAKLVYTVVQKNIHTRFMIQRQNGDVGNPPPGSVVEEDLGTPGVEGFFLIPTKCALSTVKPVHYAILHNDGAIPMPELQQLTYTMCHCYPNWTDSIKLPFPTQLAHKLAFQMGECLIAKPEIHKDLHKTYFYL